MNSVCLLLCDLLARERVSSPFQMCACACVCVYMRVYFDKSKIPSTMRQNGSEYKHMYREKNVKEIKAIHRREYKHVNILLSCVAFSVILNLSFGFARVRPLRVHTIP